MLVLWSIIISQPAFAQRPQYHIIANLDTTAHVVSGKMDITFTNNTTSTTDRIGIHLWPNAYSTDSSALVQQMLNLGNVDLYNARPEDMGGISRMNFISLDQEVEFSPDATNVDIGWLVLSKPLDPGTSIRFSSPFTLKVPVSFSRLGRTGEAYQLTQWYPHIGVFDSTGWHMMPYLDQGEFCNDFADYDVSITTPLGYTVAATGILMNKLEKGSITSWKFKAENVIDFAWFTSPYFRHEKYTVDVGGDHPVELNIYVDSLENQLWKRAGVYAQRALEFYSDWLGPYPYPQMSVVYAPLSQGGFMEYPMVAQIGLTFDSAFLDIVIAHEIGHTWLYGILANNERANPWMDEGLNTFIESQYTKRYQSTYVERFLPPLFESRGTMSQYDALQHSLQFNHTLQPPASDAQPQNEDQYLFSAYVLPAQGLEMMMSRVGEEKMKEMFRQYFSDRQFTHVSPDDLKASFQSACHCDLTWFFEGWIHHAHQVDYRIRDFDKRANEVTLDNYGNTLIPLKINTYEKGQPVMEHWIDGFYGEKIIHFDQRADEVRLFDGFGGINSHWTTNVAPRSLLPRIRLLPTLESYGASTISITPFIGTNVTDGLMPGLAFTSGLIPQQHLKFVIAPMYGLESKKFRGHATLRYMDDLKIGPFDKLSLSFDLDDFGYNLDAFFGYRDHYFRWSPTLAARVTPDAVQGHITQWWKYRYVHIDQYYAQGDSTVEQRYTEEHRSYGVHELLYQLRSDFVLRPFEATANVQAGEGFVRLNLLYKQHFLGRDKHRGVWVRGYAGWLPVFNNPDARVGFSFNGISSTGYFSKDYMFDEWLGGRNASDGVFAHQVFERDANLKTLANNGVGEEWMVGSGASVALPFRFIHAYMDAALYPSTITQKVAFSYSGGLALVVWKDVFEIYIPILESQDIRQSTTYEERDAWYERISFQANIKLANPLNVIDRIQLGY